MSKEKTLTHRTYIKIAEKSKGWQWKGKLSFHLFFILLFAFSGFFGENVKTHFLYPYNGLGVLLQYSIFIQFLIYADFKKTITFNSVMVSKYHENPKNIMHIAENIKYYIKQRICDSTIEKENQSNISFVFYLYSFITLFLTMIALDKVFLFFNQPSLIHLLKILL